MKKSKLKEILIQIKKRVKLKTLILLIILLIANSYAWFVYASKVNSSITAHVSSWDVSFEIGEDESTTNVDFIVDRVYPGMETYTKSVVAHNRGETKALITYEIKTLTVFGTEYDVNEEFTEEDLKQKIDTEFPFKIKIETDKDMLDEENRRSKNND